VALSLSQNTEEVVWATAIAHPLSGIAVLQVRLTEFAPTLPALTSWGVGVVKTIAKNTIIKIEVMVKINVGSLKFTEKGITSF
jgi:hypothetical protein